MSDMSSVIVPKSTQLNADDLLVGPRTITITNVAIRPGTEQPVSISFEGDDNKPYFPCKSMARMLVAAWGADAKQYVGRSLTLYRDPKVKWAGLEVGGIRISHMSHINRTLVMALTESKQVRRPFTVQPLQSSPARNSPPPAEHAAEPATAPAEPQATPAAGNASPAKYWTPAEAEARGKEIAAILRDHDNSAANLGWAWENNKAEIMTMPANAQKGLRSVYEKEYAKIEAAANPELDPPDENQNAMPL